MLQNLPALFRHGSNARARLIQGCGGRWSGPSARAWPTWSTRSARRHDNCLSRHARALLHSCACAHMVNLLRVKILGCCSRPACTPSCSHAPSLSHLCSLASSFSRPFWHFNRWTLSSTLVPFPPDFVPFASLPYHVYRWVFAKLMSAACPWCYRSASCGPASTRRRLLAILAPSPLSQRA